MRLVIDTKTNELTVQENGHSSSMALFSKEAFELLTDQWIRVGWDQKYPYCFSWMGRPIIQLPEDMLRIQEIIFKLKPTKIIETGVAHGGSLIFYASLMKCMDIQNGQVIGIDIEVREHNRLAIENHFLYPYITIIEADSVSDEAIAKVKSMITPEDTVLVLLDSNHTKDHVSKELESYHPFVTKDSYIIATDGVMQWVSHTKKGKKDWTWNNPSQAAIEFAEKNSNFVIEQPEWPFNESYLSKNVTHWPSGWLRRIN